MIKAIQTRYAGYRFRSRLEARWAVFFEALGIKWEHEPEGFELSCGVRYLPDFKVLSPKGYVGWYEIKQSNEADDGKLEKFSHEYGNLEGVNKSNEFHVLCGDPINALGERPDHHVCPRCGLIISTMRSIAKAGDGDSWYCFHCDWDTPSGGDNDPEEGFIKSVVVYPHKGDLCLLDPYSMDAWATHVQKAAEKARGARFEHGERGNKC